MKFIISHKLFTILMPLLLLLTGIYLIVRENYRAQAVWDSRTARDINMQLGNLASDMGKLMGIYSNKLQAMLRYTDSHPGVRMPDLAETALIGAPGILGYDVQESLLDKGKFNFYGNSVIYDGKQAYPYGIGIGWNRELRLYLDSSIFTLTISYPAVSNVRLALRDGYTKQVIAGSPYLFDTSSNMTILYFAGGTMDMAAAVLTGRPDDFPYGISTAVRLTVLVILCAELYALLRYMAAVTRRQLYYQTVYENAFAGLATLRTIDGRIMHINTQGALLLGYHTPEQVMSENTSLYNHMPVGAEREKLRTTLQSGGFARDFMADVRRADGSQSWIMLLIKSFSDGSAACVMMDLSYYNGLVKEMLANNDEMNFIMDAVPSGIIMTDSEGRVTRTNIYTQIMLGTTFDELRGHTTDEIFPGEIGQMLHQDDLSILNGTVPTSCMMEIDLGVAGRQEKRYRVYKTPRYCGGNEQITGILQVYFDIDEYKQTERQLTEHMNVLELLNKTYSNMAVLEIEKRRIESQMELQQIKLRDLGNIFSDIFDIIHKPMEVIRTSLPVIRESAQKSGNTVLPQAAERSIEAFEQMSRMKKFFNYFSLPPTQKNFRPYPVLEDVTATLSSAFKAQNINLNLAPARSDSLRNITLTGYPEEFREAMINLLSYYRDALLLLRNGTPEESIHIKMYAKLMDLTIVLTGDSPDMENIRFADSLSNLKFYYVQLFIEQIMKSRIKTENTRTGWKCAITFTITE